MFQFNRDETFSGVSVLAIRACRELENVGWTVAFEDHAMVLTSGRLIREMPYSDSLTSLVYRDDMELMIMLGRRRHS